MPWTRGIEYESHRVTAGIDYGMDIFDSSDSTNFVTRSHIMLAVDILVYLTIYKIGANHCNAIFLTCVKFIRIILDADCVSAILTLYCAHFAASPSLQALGKLV